jgi:hypothetical protein
LVGDLVSQQYDPDCFHYWRRSSSARTCSELEPARRQWHWRNANDREVAPKRVELAQELVPQATSIGLLINPKNPLAEMVKRDSLAAALKLGIKLNVLHVSEDAELQEAFTTFRQSGAGALVI